VLALLCEASSRAPCWNSGEKLGFHSLHSASPLFCSLFFVLLYLAPCVSLSVSLFFFFFPVFPAFLPPVFVPLLRVFFILFSFWFSPSVPFVIPCLSFSYTFVCPMSPLEKDSSRCYCWTELLQKEEMVVKEHPLSLLQWRREKTPGTGFELKAFHG